MKEITIWRNGSWRIIQVPDTCYSLKDLKGDTYCPQVNDDIPPEQLAKEERTFEREVEEEGVWGYCLQRWNPEVDRGWEIVDSCFGFVGSFSWGSNNHYIVEEQIHQARKKGCDVCEACCDRGYLEVTTDDNRQQLQQCENCCYFNTTDWPRQAFLDGYSFDLEGYIK